MHRVVTLPHKWARKGDESSGSASAQVVASTAGGAMPLSQPGSAVRMRPSQGARPVAGGAFDSDDEWTEFQYTAVEGREEEKQTCSAQELWHAQVADVRTCGEEVCVLIGARSERAIGLIGYPRRT